MKNRLVRAILSELRDLSEEAEKGENLNRECAAVPCVYLGVRRNNSRECAAVPCLYLGKQPTYN